MIHQQDLIISTSERQTLNITSDVSALVQSSHIKNGLCHLFIRHTSASLIITENADPSVLKDIEYFLHKLVIDGDPQYEHDMEGPDDMSAHIRTLLTQSEITIPLRNGKLGLGTWQGIFLYEHRYHPQQRTITVTLQGE